MRWELKAAIQCVLSRLPFSRQIYRILQDVTGSGRLDIKDHYGRKRKFLRRMQEQQIPVEGREFLEIGTGWYPVLPILLSLIGAKRIVTVDLNPWLTPRSLKDTVEGFITVAEAVANDFDLSLSNVRSRLMGLRQQLTDGKRLPTEILASFSIDYRMPCNASSTHLPDHSIDYIISSNVLEHIPKEAIAEILVESRRILRRNGMHLHHIDPSDHYSYDPRITSANFLKYSKVAWYYLGGSGLAYHNRLRGIDYHHLLTTHGFNISHEYVIHDTKARSAIESGTLAVHPDFAAYSIDELTCAIVDIFARSTCAVALQSECNATSSNRCHPCNATKSPI
jgi:hypothetical protein